jgi:hypothetical protein
MTVASSNQSAVFQVSSPLLQYDEVRTSGSDVNNCGAVKAHIFVV